MECQGVRWGAQNISVRKRRGKLRAGPARQALVVREEAVSPKLRGGTFPKGMWEVEADLAQSDVMKELGAVESR